MISSNDITVLVGYLLFGLSELIGVLPIPANGILHSLAVGFQQSIKKPNVDLELANLLLQKNPDITSIINRLAANPQLSEVMSIISDNPDMISYIKSINQSNELKYIVTEFQNNPSMASQTKDSLEKKINLEVLNFYNN